MPSFFLMIRRPPISPLFPTRRSSDLLMSLKAEAFMDRDRPEMDRAVRDEIAREDRKSTRLNSSHGYISYAVFFFNDPAPPDISSLSYTTLFRSPDEPQGRGLHGPRSARDGQGRAGRDRPGRSEEHTSELQSRLHLVCRLFF